MDIVKAIQIVLDLAKQNIIKEPIDECLIDEVLKQQKAIKVVEKALDLAQRLPAASITHKEILKDDTKI